jgi:hypothetical protein
MRIEKTNGRGMLQNNNVFCPCSLICSFSSFVQVQEAQLAVDTQDIGQRHQRAKDPGMFSVQ